MTRLAHRSPAPRGRRGAPTRRRRRAALAAAVAALAGAPPALADGALNGRIAFTSFRDGQAGDLWTTDPDGSDLRKVTGGAEYDAQADWSPDGRRIAFRRGPDAFVRLGIWTTDLYGEGATLLAEGDPAEPRQNVSQPSWAPDGRSLLFRGSLPPSFPDSDVWRMGTDGSERRPVARLSGHQLYPSWSPDMDEVLFTGPRASAPSADRGIYALVVADGTVRRVFDRPGSSDSAPSWSPDGRRVAFESDMDGDMDVYVIDADGTDLRRLTDDPGHDEGPVWSPDGLRLVYTSGPVDNDGDVWTMDADGTDRRRLFTLPGVRDESPDWQPIPHEGDLRACGDVVRSGAGAYSVKAGGRGLACDTAKDVAARWSAEALAGRPGDHVRGFGCRTSDAGYEALLVECAHRGASPDGRTGNEKALAFVHRPG